MLIGLERRRKRNEGQTQTKRQTSKPPTSREQRHSLTSCDSKRRREKEIKQRRENKESGDE